MFSAAHFARCRAILPLLHFSYLINVKPVKITGSVVFCMLITILNTLLITMQNVLHFLF